MAQLLLAFYLGSDDFQLTLRRCLFIHIRPVSTKPHRVNASNKLCPENKTITINFDPRSKTDRNSNDDDNDNSINTTHFLLGKENTAHDAMHHIAII
mmetsp:Transcript_44313/g.73898  ORF Transcript_44313/g.73898 Transcript_44313/m.73898 type:complete len:97 (-) Transcript_44313:1676-1966(-)